MKHLFETDEHKHLTVAPQVQLIKEFSDLLTARNSTSLYSREVAAVYFFADMRSPYYRYEDEERWLQIASDIMFGYTDWLPDDYVKACVAKYKELTFTPSMLSLKAADSGISAYRLYLEQVDLNERNEKGMLINNPTTVKGMIKDLPVLIKARQELEDIVMSDINENNTLQAGRRKGAFEDPEDHMG